MKQHLGHNKKSEGHAVRLTVFGDILDNTVEKSAQRRLQEDTPIGLTFADFFSDSPAAQAHREKLAKAVVPDRPREMKQSAVDERERLIGEYLHAHPAETRENAIHAVYSSNEGLYARCWKEETHSVHGGRLSEIYSRASATFGVDQEGQPITKADVEAVVVRKALMVLAKSARATTLNDAIGTVLASDPDLYQQWRAATYV
jgi:hypothetical protein